MPKLTPLSLEASEAKKPPKPEELIDALQDKVHTEIGKVRVAKTARFKRSQNEAETNVGSNIPEVLHNENSSSGKETNS